MSHHTIRDEDASSSATRDRQDKTPPHPSLTPATDSAHRVIASGQAEMADKLRLSGPDGVKARITMAMQNALVLALSAEIDAGNFDRMALLHAAQTAIGCNMSQAIGMIMAGAPPEVRNAALMMIASNATSLAAATINMDRASISVATETVKLPQAGVA
jgi:hypothetical protein